MCLSMKNIFGIEYILRAFSAAHFMCIVPRPTLAYARSDLGCNILALWALGRISATIAINNIVLKLNVGQILSTARHWYLKVLPMS